MLRFQDQLYQKLQTVKKLPRSLIIEGESGCGKNTFIEDLSQQFTLPVLDISEMISSGLIVDMQLSGCPAIYKINIGKVSIKDQNRLLKILEEPSDNIFLIIACENHNQIIPTIANRCQIWSFKPYSKSELAVFNSNELLLKLCKTPGQIERYKNLDIEFLYSQAKLILEKICVATLPNTLSLSKYIAFNESDSTRKYPVDLFIKSVALISTEYYIERSDVKYIQSYKLCETYLYKLQTPRIDTKYLFDAFLIELRALMKKE